MLHGVAPLSTLSRMRLPPSVNCKQLSARSALPLLRCRLHRGMPTALDWLPVTVCSIPNGFEPLAHDPALQTLWLQKIFAPF